MRRAMTRHNMPRARRTRWVVTGADACAVLVAVLALLAATLAAFAPPSAETALRIVENAGAGAIEWATSPPASPTHFAARTALFGYVLRPAAWRCIQFVWRLRPRNDIS